MASKDELVSLDSVDTTGDIKLTAKKDGKDVTVKKSDAVISALIKGAIETDPKSVEIVLQELNYPTLLLVKDYMEHHQGKDPAIVEKPLKSNKMSDVCKDAWDAKFIDDIDTKNRQQLYDIILAANYLDIRSLLHLGCAKVASLIKGQPLDKIKDILAPGTKYVDKKATTASGEEKKD